MHRCRSHTPKQRRSSTAAASTCALPAAAAESSPPPPRDGAGGRVTRPLIRPRPVPCIPSTPDRLSAAGCPASQRPGKPLSPPSLRLALPHFPPISLVRTTAGQASQAAGHGELCSVLPWPSASGRRGLCSQRLRGAGTDRATERKQSKERREQRQSKMNIEKRREGDRSEGAKAETKRAGLRGGARECGGGWEGVASGWRAIFLPFLRVVPSVLCLATP